MIFNFKKKKDKFPVKLFVIAALLNFVLVLAGVFILQTAFVIHLSRKTPAAVETAYFNKKFKSGDPLVTKMPDFRDYITGPLASQADPSLGKDTARVTIYQFGDYQCAPCGRNLETIKKLLIAYPDKVRFQWKDFAGTDLKSSGWQTAMAARCAADQDKFSEYSKTLFSAGKNLTAENLKILAKNVGIGNNVFSDCLLGYIKNKYIIDNLTEADILGISGTPTVYVNDKKIGGEVKYEDLKKAVEAELAKFK